MVKEGVRVRVRARDRTGKDFIPPFLSVLKSDGHFCLGLLA